MKNTFVKDNQMFKIVDGSGNVTLFKTSGSETVQMANGEQSAGVVNEFDIPANLQKRLLT